MAIRPLAIASVLLSSAAAFAGPVTGTVSVPAGAGGKSAPRGKAYLPRIENPLVPVKPVDPMPYLVVVLEKDGLELPPSAQYPLELRGESFDHPLLPVVAGAEVEIRNQKNSRKSPTLYVDGQPDLLAETPLNPGANRAFKVGSDVGKILVVKDKKSKHLQATILVLPTPYFAVPESDGSYSIKDVKDGDYTVKVWYRDGWVKGSESTVKVSGGKAEKKNVDLKSLETVGAAPADGAP